jgi:hypothetical protein
MREEHPINPQEIIVSYELSNIEFRGPFTAEFWEGIVDAHLKEEQGVVKVVGTGMTPFGAALRACGEARQTCGMALDYKDIVVAVMERVTDTCHDYMRVRNPNPTHKMYAVLTLFKYG